MPRIDYPSEDLAKGVRTYSAPLTSTRTVVRAAAHLTRESWPGESTLARSITGIATAIQVPLGMGDAFPDGGTLAIMEGEGGPVEVVNVIARVGDIFTVERTSRNPFPSGSIVLHRGIIIVRIERSVDGVNWIEMGRCEMGGGIERNRTPPYFRVTHRDVVTGEAVELPGDVRVVTEVKVGLRTAVSVVNDEKAEVPVRTPSVVRLNPSGGGQ